MEPSEPKPTVKCHVCDKYFSSKSNCTRHIKNVHRVDLNGIPIVDRPQESFTCVLCDKKFAAKQNLEHHMNVVHLLNPKKFKCSECAYETVHRSNLKRHLLSHKTRQDTSQICSAQNFKCSECPVKYKKLRNLKYHQRKTHKLGVAIPTRRKCPVCPFTSILKSKFDIYNHFEKIHDVPVRQSNYNFDTVDEFNSWKNDTEKATATSYIKTKSANNVTYYQCHRCGYHKCKGHLKRHMKMSGSCKINGFCPASITMKIKNNKVQVRFVSTHVGHKNDLKYLRLTNEEKKAIALQLASKKPHEEILKSIRGSLSNLDLQRIHLTNKKDIINVENSFNLHEESVKHPFDPVSIASWVKDLSNSDEIALIVYKPQGLEDPEFPDLKADDFLLMFMTEAQKNMVRKYGHDTICIDGTHGLNSYDFQLYTLLVLDDTREGFPAAFMFTNRGDEYVISKFFEAIKSVTGCITPKVFMSDMEETFFSAWKKQMGVPENRLFCAWHVLKAWRTNINKKVKNKEKRDYIQNILKTMMYELDINSFQQLLSGSLNVMTNDPELKFFCDYFETYYVKNERFKTWAYCYRVHAGVNTNMSIENFNRLLKYCYLRGKQVRRLDKTLCAILNLLRDKLFDLLIKLKRGKLVRKLQVLRKNHKRSFTFFDNCITKLEGKWQVLSSEKTEMYTVKRVKVCKKCQLRCLHCESCFHEFVCSCMDSCIKNNMCKHIHAVAKYELKDGNNSYNDKNSSNGNGQLIIDFESDNQEHEEIVTHISQKIGKNITLEQSKLDLIKKLDTLTSRITTIEQATFVGNEITKIITTLDAMNMPTTSRSTLNVKTSVPVNANVVPQRKFKTTKKTKVKKIANQNSIEKQKLALELLGYK